MKIHELHEGMMVAFYPAYSVTKGKGLTQPPVLIGRLIKLHEMSARVEVKQTSEDTTWYWNKKDGNHVQKVELEKFLKGKEYSLTVDRIIYEVRKKPA